MEEKSSRLDEFRLRNNHTWNHAIRIIYTLARYAASSLQNHECARDFRQRTRVRLAASMEAASARNNATLSLLTFSPPIPRSILPLYYTVQFRAVSSSPVIYSDGSLHASGALSWWSRRPLSDPPSRRIREHLRRKAWMVCAPGNRACKTRFLSLFLSLSLSLPPSLLDARIAAHREKWLTVKRLRRLGGVQLHHLTTRNQLCVTVWLRDLSGRLLVTVASCVWQIDATINRVRTRCCPEWNTKVSYAGLCRDPNPRLCSSPPPLSPSPLLLSPALLSPGREEEVPSECAISERPLCRRRGPSPRASSLPLSAYRWSQIVMQMASEILARVCLLPLARTFPLYPHNFIPSLARDHVSPPISTWYFSLFLSLFGVQCRRKRLAVLRSGLKSYVQ